MLTIGSLFSGIGGLELGLEWAGLGPVVWQVENDAFCRDVLARHWPDADRSVVDVRRAGRANLAPVDLVCGGAPCQDLSSAGKGAGITGIRSGLWFEFERIIREMEPSWVVVENVASGAKRWVDVVISGLECLGYAAVPFPVSAQDVGLNHERKRVFVVAHLEGKPLRRARLPWLTRGVEAATDAHSQREQQPQGCVSNQRRRSGDGHQEDSTHPNGNELRHQPGRSRGARGADEAAGSGADCTGDASDSGILRCEPRSEPGGSPEKQPETAGQGRRSPKPNLVRDIHGLSYALDDGRSVPAIGHGRRKGDTDRRRALGNSVVPQCAEVVGWIVRELMA